MNQPDTEEILKRYKTLAVVGLSKNPEKTSYQVAEYLQNQIYQIIPVNPTADKILGKEAYKSPLDIPPIVDQAIQLKKLQGLPYLIWMQLRIVNQQAAEKAKRQDSQ